MIPPSLARPLIPCVQLPSLYHYYFTALIILIASCCKIKSTEAFGVGGKPAITTIISPPSIFVPPIFGIGALLFKPRGMTIRPSYGEDSDLVEAGEFFTDAFWTGKVGGAKKLTPVQSKSLERQQVTEFRRRYGKKMSTADRRAELLLCRNGKGEFMGCAGIEVDTISKANGMSGRFKAPLMSNLAVGRKFRRRGIAEELVRAAEEIARKEWGYDECYLYVEKRNTPAIRLYRKLGYGPIWEDDQAKTLVPSESGAVRSVPTVIVCMKKRLGGISGLLGWLLPF